MHWRGNIAQEEMSSIFTLRRPEPDSYRNEYSVYVFYCYIHSKYFLLKYLQTSPPADTDSMSATIFHLQLSLPGADKPKNPEKAIIYHQKCRCERSVHEAICEYAF